MQEQERASFFYYLLKIIRFFFRNVVQRVTAIFLAFIIWMLVGNQNPLNDTEFQLNTPVSYTNIPNNLVVINELLEVVNITITAQSRDTNKIKSSNFQVVLELGEIKKGENIIAITSKNIQSDINFQLISFTPQNLVVQADRVAEKPVDVSVIFAGLEGRVITKLQKTPSSVLIRGPISVLRHLDYIETLPVNINQDTLEQDFVVGLNLKKHLSVLEGVENIAGKILLGDKAKSVLFEEVPVFPIKSDFEVRSNPKTINVLLLGTEEFIKSIKKDKLTAYIDLNNYQPGKYVIKDFGFNLPTEISVKKAWPPVDIWILNNKK